MNKKTLHLGKWYLNNGGEQILVYHESWLRIYKYNNQIYVQ
jgi:hypothetical protein